MPRREDQEVHKEMWGHWGGDFRLVGPPTKHLAGKQFVRGTDKKQAAISWLQTLGSEYFYYTGRTSLGAML